MTRVCVPAEVERPGAKALPALTALRAVISNGALKAEQLPERIKIFGWGDNPSTKGTFRAGEKTAATLAANQRAFGFERVAIDYNHCTVEGSPEYVKGQPKAIFGYGTIAAKPGEGIFLEQIEWTPLGVANARNYEDLSPAAHQEDGEIDFIHSVALTPNGCLYDVTFFSAAARSAEATPAGAKQEQEPDPMSETNKTQLDAANVITVAEMAPIVGLAATATKADVLGKLTLLSILGSLSALVKDGKVLIVEAVAGLENRIKTIEAAASKGVALLSATIDGKAVSYTAEDVVKLAARVDGLETAIKAQASSTTELEKGKLLALFAAEGKAPKDANGQPYTAEGLKGLDVTTLRLLHANTPSTVPLAARSRAAREGTGLDPNLKGRARFIAAQERDATRVN